jgi:hypothetical protein
MDLREVTMGEQKTTRADALVVRVRTEREDAFPDRRYEPAWFPPAGKELATNAKLFFGRLHQLRLDVT